MTVPSEGERLLDDLAGSGEIPEILGPLAEGDYERALEWLVTEAAASPPKSDTIIQLPRRTAGGSRPRSTDASLRDSPANRFTLVARTAEKADAPGKPDAYCAFRPARDRWLGRR
jgi:hypothetical protein